ncbi:MAG: hypothetical protein IPO21_16915 [Bacteroidales bacterium]|nr:hypothetical protein [Bacteroidales bacterium]
MKTKIEKTFDAVEFMRQQRDAISKDIANMTYEQLKQYFAKSKTDERIIPSR